MADDLIVKKGLVGIIILGIFMLAFLIIKPIIISIILGLLFAYIFNPIFQKLNLKIKSKSLVTTIILIGITIIITLPIVYLSPLIVNQIFDIYVMFQNFNFSKTFSSFLSPELARSVSLNLDNLIGQTFSFLLNQFKNILINLPSYLLQFAVFLFTFFFALRDSDKLIKYVSNLSPFSKSTREKFLSEFRGITNAIIFGQVLIGIIQGLALGIGLFFLGASKVLLLTFISIIVSMIPFLGSGIVWLPMGMVYLFSGEIFKGIFLLLYGSLFISSIDNVYRSYILSKKSNLPIVLSIIGTIGGLYLFGIVGLILGPLILAYTLIIIELYKEGKLNELFKKR